MSLEKKKKECSLHSITSPAGAGRYRSVNIHLITTCIHEKLIVSVSLREAN